MRVGVRVCCVGALKEEIYQLLKIHCVSWGFIFLQKPRHARFEFTNFTPCADQVSLEVGSLYGGELELGLRDEVQLLLVDLLQGLQLAEGQALQLLAHHVAQLQIQFLGSGVQRRTLRTQWT